MSAPLQQPQQQPQQNELQQHHYQHHPPISTTIDFIALLQSGYWTLYPHNKESNEAAVKSKYNILLNCLTAKRWKTLKLRHSGEVMLVNPEYAPPDYIDYADQAAPAAVVDFENLVEGKDYVNPRNYGHHKSDKTLDHYNELFLEYVIGTETGRRFIQQYLPRTTQLTTPIGVNQVQVDNSKDLVDNHFNNLMGSMKSLSIGTGTTPQQIDDALSISKSVQERLELLSRHLEVEREKNKRQMELVAPSELVQMDDTHEKKHRTDNNSDVNSEVANESEDVLFENDDGSISISSDQSGSIADPMVLDSSQSEEYTLEFGNTNSSTLEFISADNMSEKASVEEEEGETMETDNDSLSNQTSQELTKGQKRHDKQRMVNGISTRNRSCEALRGVDASSLQNAELREMPSDEQAKIARIGNVLSSISANSGKTDDLVHRLLKAYGLDDDSITEILNRMPDGDLHELKTYIRASPNVNKATLAASVLSQHLSHRMSATLHEEFHSVKLNHSAPHIAMSHSRHDGKTSTALAHLIHDLIKRIEDTPDINLYVMVTEALRFDESLEIIRQIINVFKELKVKELVLDSMELDTVGFAAIDCKHRQKKRDIGKVACQKHAGKSIISADQPTQLKIYKAAEPIQDDINAGCTDNVTFNTIDKAKKDGDNFVKKYRNAIEECNKESQRLLKKVEAGDITAKEAIRQYLELPVLKSIPADQIPKLVDYGRSSRGTLKDPNYQLSLNVAVGRVLYNDDESVERMIIRDMHKNRDELGREGFAAHKQHHLHWATIVNTMCQQVSTT